MSFDTYLNENRQLLRAHYALSKWYGTRFQLEMPFIQGKLTEAELEGLKCLIRDQMPLETIITGLWDYDLRFEEDLEDEWFFESAFGDAVSEDFCVEDLCNYFLEKNEEHGIFDNELDSYDDFRSSIEEESLNFIRKWREKVFLCLSNADQVAPQVSL